MTIVYVLLLTEHKYYIGKTEDESKIHKIHFTNTSTEVYTPKSSIWTGIYRPLSIEYIYENTEDDTKITLEYMDKKGIDNVRGGAFSEIYLSKEKKDFINQLLNKSSRCHFCGSSEHLIENCPEKNQVVFRNPVWDQLCCIGIFSYIGTLINPCWGAVLCSMFGSYASTSISYNHLNTNKYKEQLTESISITKTYFNDYFNNKNMNIFQKQNNPPKTYEVLLLNKPTDLDEV
jgi:hypothetical protein